MRGIGGREAVIEKQVDFVEVSELRVGLLTIEIRAVDYGFSINGIFGMNFLIQTRAIIDFKTLEIRKA
jgi:hypothetical protein